MCGICGLAHTDPERPVDVDALQRMNDALVHRGPDDDGVFVGAGVGLAMRRLSIIDLEGGAQPVQNEDGRVQLVFNGEIYNYRALRAELLRSGHRFTTHSDTETVVHGYEEWGEGLFERLRGMFALAIWDAEQRKLVLAVDRMGIKPLYYAERDGGLVFASELSALRRSGMVGDELETSALAEYFTFGYVPAPATILDGVQKLEPASILTWRPGHAPSIRGYWSLPAGGADVPEDPAELRAAVREQLTDAVRCHLESDVPIGVFLSGGMDSSSIVALLSEIATEPIRTFSVGFDVAAVDELGLARLVAERFRSEHHEIRVQADAAAVLPELVRHFGEPFADASALPTYFVSKAASEHVKVALSGDGGDETFLGYTMFRGVELARRLEAVPAPARSLVRGSIERATTLLPGDRDGLRRVGKRAADSLRGAQEAYFGKSSLPGLAAVGPYLSPELRQAVGRAHPFARLGGVLAEEGAKSLDHPLEVYSRAALRFSLPNDMLVKVDRMSMANSLEVRVPFLDHVLAEFVSAVPIRERLPGWRLKGLLRDTMAPSLPPEIVSAPKRGFVIPLSAWFRNGLREFVGDVLLDADTADGGLVQRAELERLVKSTDTGFDSGTVLWSLLMLELWRRDVEPARGASQPVALTR
jgi:asparagine synthase (glutamine-hydrolysing)